MTVAEITLREGGPADLEDTFALSMRVLHCTAVRFGIQPAGPPPREDEIARQWESSRAMLEFIAAQPGGRYWIAETGEGEIVGYARVVRFDVMEELTELVVDPEHQGQGIARGLLSQCWPGDPTPELGRVVVATGAPADLSLYMRFGVMPIAGHWHMRIESDAYLEARSLEIDATEPDVHVLTPERAAAEWKRLEPPAIGHERPALHDFFGRDRNCLATLDQDARATALCWVSSGGEIGPAVAATPEDLVPVVLQALDRVARSNEPEHLGVYATTISWWVMKRLRGLGFRVWWPSWIMSSIPLPGLDRYLATRPPHLL